MGKKAGPTGAIVSTSPSGVVPLDGAPKPAKAPPVYEPNTRTIEKRKCRDVLFLLIFIAFWAGMLAIAGSAYNNGDPKKLILGLDYKGNVCGSNKGSPDLSGFKIRYWMNPADLMDASPTVLQESRSICLKDCPVMPENNTVAWICDYPMGAPNPLGWDMDAWAACNYDYFDLLTPPQRASSINLTGPCYPILWQTTDFFWSCMPDGVFQNTSATYSTWTSAPINGSLLFSASSYVQDEVKSMLNKPSAIVQRYVADLGNAWRVLVIAGAVAPFVFGFVYLVLMRFFTGVMAWLSILLVNVLLVTVTLYTYAKAGWIGKDQVTQVIGPDTVNTLDLANTNTTEALKGIAIFLTVVTALFFLFTLLMIRRIIIAIAVLKVAAGAVGHTPSVIFFPILPTFVLLGFGAYWGSVSIYLFGDGAITPNTCASTDCCQYSFTTLNVTCGVEQCCGYSISYNNRLKWTLLYHIFGLFWTGNFIVAVSLTTVAGTIAGYYWSKGQSSAVPFKALSISLYRVLRYHLGSLALGSFLIAVVEFIRFIAEYIRRKIKEAGQETALVKWGCCCFQCFMSCLQWLVDFINKNAYIMIAIKGKAFCKSATTATKLVISNALRVGAVNVIGDLILFLGKFAVSLACAVLAFGMLDSKRYKIGDDKVSSPVAPVLFCWAVAYFVASIFFGVVEMAVDTVLLSFCEDCEENGGAPRFAPPLLMETLSVSSKRLEDEEKAKKAAKAALQQAQVAPTAPPAPA